MDRLGILDLAVFAISFAYLHDPSTSASFISVEFIYLVGGNILFIRM